MRATTSTGTTRSKGPSRRTSSPSATTSSPPAPTRRRARPSRRSTPSPIPVTRSSRPNRRPWMKRRFSPATTTSCTNTVEWKRLHAASPIDLHVQLSRLVPEVIFLSEELKDAPFPSMLQPCPELRYRKVGSIRALLDPQVDAKNEIAAYVLMDEKYITQVVYQARTLVRPGVKHDEKWLCVQKIVPEFRVYFEVAGVHLDAAYTGYSSPTKKQEALEEVGQFARENEVDALLGDLNMDSFELNGGFYPNRFSFKSFSDDTVKPVYTLSHSNTNAKNNYMGGLIANSAQVETEPMNLRGEDTVSLSRTLDGKFYSDHPAIMANYFKSFA